MSLASLEPVLLHCTKTSCGLQFEKFITHSSFLSAPRLFELPEKVRNGTSEVRITSGSSMDYFYDNLVEGQDRRDTQDRVFQVGVMGTAYYGRV